MANVTRTKARKILRDGSVRGKPLTDRQRRLFGAIAGGRRQQLSALRRANGRNR